MQQATQDIVINTRSNTCKASPIMMLPGIRPYRNVIRHVEDGYIVQREMFVIHIELRPDLVGKLRQTIVCACVDIDNTTFFSYMNKPSPCSRKEAYRAAKNHFAEMI